MFSCECDAVSYGFDDFVFVQVSHHVLSCGARRSGNHFGEQGVVSVWFHVAFTEGCNQSSDMVNGHVERAHRVIQRAAHV